MSKNKPISIIMKIIGIILLGLGLFYLLVPHTTHINLNLDFGMEHHHHVALGGLLLVLGSILTLNGKRLKTGLYFKGWKKIPVPMIILTILTFAFLYMWFNSGFELLASDINPFKILMFRISSIGLSVMLIIGMIRAQNIFGLKNTRY